MKLREAVAIAIAAFFLYAYFAGYYVANYQVKPNEHQYQAQYQEHPGR